MSTTTAPLLPQEYQPPTQYSPSVRPEVVRDHDADIALFGEDKWSLAAVGRTSGTAPETLHFSGFPEGPWRQAAKHFVYLLINDPTPDSLFERENSGTVRWQSQGTIKAHVSKFRDLVKLIAALPSSAKIDSPQRLTSWHLDKLRDTIDKDIDLSPNSKNYLKWLLVRLPHHNPWLSEELQWTTPAWDDHGKRLWRTPVPRGNNKIRPIDDEVMAMLLEWSLTLVAAADEIVAGYDKRQRLEAAAEEASKGGMSEARRVMNGYLERGEPVPGSRHRAGAYGGVAQKFLAGVYGLYYESFGRAAREMELFECSTAPAATSLGIPIRTQIQGRYWIDHLSYYDYQRHGGQRPELLTHLQSACLIVICYLSGMRGGEAVRLKRGCAVKPHLTPKGNKLHLVSGRVHKRQNTRAESRDHEDESARDAAWATIPEVHQAIRVAESIQDALGVDTDLLFPDHCDPTRPLNGSSKQLIKYTKFINRRLVPDVQDIAWSIPEDTYGNITLGRFRRTLAWHIYNQPGGHIALAIQYQHLSLKVGEGYAGRLESGFPAELAQAKVERSAEILSGVKHGEGVSGPGAQRVVEQARRLPNPQQISEAAYRKLCESVGLVYEGVLFNCVDDPDKRACEIGERDEPNLSDCRRGCENRFTLDGNIDSLEREIEWTRAQIKLSLEPLAVGFREDLAYLIGRLNEHQKRALHLCDGTPESDPSFVTDETVDLRDKQGELVP